MEKILTISIAAYNAELDIKRCLDSFISTNVLEELELIVVNDGSKDNTLNVAKQYEKKYPGIIKVIDKKNGGHGSTINASIKEATGKYYKIVDSDDWIDPEELEKLVFWLRNNDADLVLTPYKCINADKIEDFELIYPYDAMMEIKKITNIEKKSNIIVYMHSTTFKKEVIKRMGPIIDENCFYVDLEYTIFPLYYIKNFVCLDYIVYQYLLGTDEQSMNIKNMIKRRNQHLKVVTRIINYYSDKKRTLKEPVQEIILNRIHSAILSQYKIYANMEPKESIAEVKKFDMWLKQFPELYTGAQGRFMKIIYLNRATRFMFYAPIIRILKIMHLEPKI